MKKTLPIMLAFCLFLSSCTPLYPQDVWDSTAEQQKHEPFTVGMWLSQFDLTSLCVDRDRQRSKTEFLRLVEQMMDRIVALGVNTVFIQARPNGDSMYPSALFPASHYAVGSINGAWSYDPYALIVKEARSRGLAVHGWINPLRCFTVKNKKAIPSDHPILSLSAQMREVGGVLYLDPSSPAVRDYIAKGAEELLVTYSLDGIHIDDYFYPTTDESFDGESYRLYLEAHPHASLSEFRRESVNALVAQLYETVHQADPRASFGVSPSGNAERNLTVLYADVSRWCAEEGYVDYILPQIYFGEEHEALPFTKTCHDFAASVKNPNVRFYVGLTLEKAYRGSLGEEDVYAGAGSDEWIRDKNVLQGCLNSLADLERCRGIFFFSYRLFYDPISGEAIAETATEVEGIRRALAHLTSS